MRSFILASAALIALLAAGAASAEPRIDALRQTLSEKPGKALDGIPDQGRKLLAMRSYLRSAKSLESRWSWSEAEIDAYKNSDQYVSAMAAVAAVTKAFEIKNPGYSLHVNTEVRSLEEQISKWNDNASVQAAGAEIDAATTKWLQENAKAGPDELRVFLSDFQPQATVMLAAPGLTNHGRGEAIDFQISKGGAVVVGAGSGGTWESEGWSAKLKQAVTLSMMPFEGPLTDPNEPWHYDYEPPHRSQLVVADEPKPDGQKPTEPTAYASTPAEPAAPSATEPSEDVASTPTEPVAEDDAVAPPIAGAVPVPAPRPETPSDTAAADELAQAQEKAAQAAPKKATRKKAGPAKKRVNRTKSRTTKKRRFRLPFNL